MMNNNSFIFILAFGVLLMFIISLMPFIDFVGLILIIIPSKMKKGFNYNPNIKKSALYIKHKKKWKKILGFTSFVYLLFYCVITFLFDSILIGFYSAIIASVFYFGIAGNFEHKQREKIRFKIESRDENKGKAVDDTMP